MSWDDYIPMAVSLLGTPVMIGGFLLISTVPWAGWTLVIVGESLQFVMMPLAKQIARWRAGLIHHIKCQPTSGGGPNFWSYIGQLVLRYSIHPETITKVRNFRCPDGHFEPLVYVTPVKLPGILNRVRHPYYNAGRALPSLVLVHPLPFDLQFKFSDDLVGFKGYSVKVSTVAWAVLDEMMPKTIGRLASQMFNLLPNVDEELRHVPWYYVVVSSGTRANMKLEQTEAPKVLKVGVTAGGQTAYFCPECEEPLKVSEDFGECKNGHKWKDLR